MLSLLKNRPYAALFAAQVIALIGTGLMSVALALLAFDLAGEKAGAVLGTALAIKLLAYVFLSPVITALTAHLPRKRVMVLADVARASVALALLMAAFGAGSILAALALPRVLDRLGDRAVMQAGSWGLSGTALALAGVMALVSVPDWPMQLAVWALFGIGWSLVLTPTGRLLRQSGGTADRPALFAAQFALSHACWLLAYPLAGWAGQAVGLTAALAALGAIAALATLLARHLWPPAPTTKTAKTR